MVVSKKGFTDKDGVFRSYKETIAVAKRQVLKDKNDGVATDDWIVELSELSPKDKVKLERIIEERKFSEISTVSENTSEEAKTPTEAPETVTRPGVALTFNDVLYGRSRNAGSTPVSEPVNVEEIKDELAVVSPHSLFSGGDDSWKRALLKTVKETVTEPDTETEPVVVSLHSLVNAGALKGGKYIVQETPVDLKTEVVTVEEPEKVYPITIFEKEPRNWGSGSAWFASVYLFFSLAILGTTFMVFNQLATSLKLDLSFTNVGEKLFFLLSIIGFVSILLGVMGFVRAKKDGFSKKLSIVGTSISVITFIGLFILFNNVLPLLTYPGL